MKVTIIGTGYVGLVTGACLAETGNDVLCIDNDRNKIERILKGDIPIYEPGLGRLINRGVESGLLNFSVDIEDGVRHGQILMIAVGTPPNEDGSADLSHVLTVAGDIGKHINEHRVIVTKSTVPVGTADKVRTTVEAALADRGVDVEFDVVSNPEFLKEGAAIDDFMKPDRIVVGADSSRAIDMMRSLYAPYNRSHDRVMVMDIRSAELTKYAANAMLATRISFMNEIANLAERVGADIESIRLGIGSDPRIGYSFIYPGCGYGGSCFPKDVQALARTSMEHGYESKVLTAVESVNDEQKVVPADKIKSHFGDDLNGRHFAIWGLAFKPETDDMREAPSRVIIKELTDAGATVAAFDPVAGDEARHIFADNSSVKIVDTALDALRDADALVLVTEWKQFRSPDFGEIKNLLKTPVVIDGRNVYDPKSMKELGFSYYAIGR